MSAQLPPFHFAVARLGPAVAVAALFLLCPWAMLEARADSEPPATKATTKEDAEPKGVPPATGSADPKASPATEAHW